MAGTEIRTEVLKSTLPVLVGEVQASQYQERALLDVIPQPELSSLQPQEIQIMLFFGRDDLSCDEPLDILRFSDADGIEHRIAIGADERSLAYELIAEGDTRYKSKRLKWIPDFVARANHLASEKLKPFTIDENSRTIALSLGFNLPLELKQSSDPKIDAYKDRGYDFEMSPISALSDQVSTTQPILVKLPSGLHRLTYQEAELAARITFFAQETGVDEAPAAVIDQVLGMATEPDDRVKLNNAFIAIAKISGINVADLFSLADKPEKLFPIARVAEAFARATIIEQSQTETLASYSTELSYLRAVMTEGATAGDIYSRLPIHAKEYVNALASAVLELAARPEIEGEKISGRSGAMIDSLIKTGTIDEIMGDLLRGPLHRYMADAETLAKARELVMQTGTDGGSELFEQTLREKLTRLVVDNSEEIIRANQVARDLEPHLKAIEAVLGSYAMRDQSWTSIAAIRRRLNNIGNQALTRSLYQRTSAVLDSLEIEHNDGDLETGPDQIIIQMPNKQTADRAAEAIIAELEAEGQARHGGAINVMANYSFESGSHLAKYKLEISFGGGWQPHKRRVFTERQ